MKIRLPVRKPGPPAKRPPKLKLKASVARSRRAPVVEEEEDDFLEEPEPNMRLSHAFVVVLVLHVIAVAGVFAFNSIKARQADIFSAVKDEPAKTAAAAPNATEPMASAASDTQPTSTAEAANPTNSIMPTSTAPTQTAVAPAPAQAAPAVAPIASAPSSGKTHELQAGETLTKVAAQYGVSIADLKAANNITDPTKMRIGTVLMIPAATSAPAAVKAAAVAPVAKSPEATEPAVTGVKDSGKFYTVVKGDNPVKIAKHLKVSYANLLALNGITDPRKLQIGQKLKVPVSK